MEALRKKDKDLYRRVKKTKISHRFKISRHQDYFPGLFDSEMNYAFYQNPNPLFDVKKNIDDLKIKNAKLAVFLGFGLGYELMVFVNQCAERNKTHFIGVFEKEIELFKMALMNVDLSFFLSNDKIRFFVGEQLDHLFPKLVDYFGENQKFMLIKAMKVLYNPVLFSHEKVYYLTVLKTLREAATHKIIDYGDSPQDSLVGVENMLLNLNEIVENPGINLLKDKFKGKPAIVASTGPSLDKNKHLLKGLEDKALIVAPEASLRPLLSIGVKPHILTTMERTIPVKDLVSGFEKTEVEDIYLGACPVIDREVFESYPGPRIIVYRSFDHFKWLAIDKGMLNIKTSAGNMAFKVCDYLGCNPIILIGQDLSFSSDGKTHAQNTPRTQDGKLSSSEIRKQGTPIPYPGNVEKTVYTTKTWIPCIKGYERDISDFNGRCINSTEGGVFIKGTTIMPLQESIQKFIQKDFSPLKTIKQELSKFGNQDIEKERHTVIKLIDKTLMDLDELQEKYKEAFDYIVENEKRFNEALEDSEKLKNLQPELERIEETVYHPVDWGIRYKHYTLQLLLTHIIQPVNIQHIINRHGVEEYYDNENQVKLARVLLEKQHFLDIVNLISIVKDTLYASLETFKTNKWTRSQNNINFHKFQMPVEKFLHYFGDIEQTDKELNV